MSVIVKTKMEEVATSSMDLTNNSNVHFGSLSKVGSSPDFNNGKESKRYHQRRLTNPCRKDKSAEECPARISRRLS